MKIFAICLLSIGLCAGAVTPALAAPRDETLAGISRCYGLGDDRALLDCIYGAAQPLRAELGLQPASPAQIRLVPPVVGAAVAAAPPPPMNAAVLARASGALHMASYKFSPDGFFLVTLSNGESWKQSSTDIKHARWKEPPESYSVTVTQNWAGSDILTVKGDRSTYFIEKVR